MVNAAGHIVRQSTAAAAGLKSLEILRRPGQYDRLNALGQSIMDMINAALSDTGAAYHIVGEPSLFEVVFAQSKPRDYRDVAGVSPCVIWCVECSIASWRYF